MFLECSKSAINAKKKALIEFYEEVQMVFENRLALLENITTDKLEIRSNKRLITLFCHCILHIIPLDINHNLNLPKTSKYVQNIF